MSRPMTRVVHVEHVECSVEDNVAGFLADRKPIGTLNKMSKSDQRLYSKYTYIPSAFSESVLITRSLSASLHLLIALAELEFTTDTTYSAISFFCPLSS